MISGSAFVALLALLCLGSPLEAQAIAPMVHPAPAPLFDQEERLFRSTPRHAGLTALAGGAALGGVLGAAGAAALAMPLNRSGGWGPPPAVIAAAVAYPLGAGVGVHWLGRTQGVSAPILASFAGTAIGAGVWAGIGNAFDPEARGESASGTDYTAWIVGSALGFASHVVVTAVLTDRWQR